MLLGSVGQRSLHRRRLVLADRPLEGASLFPFFDERGRTRAVMITTEESARILLVDWHPDLFERHWLRDPRLRLRYSDLGDAEAADAERLADLWHFDPWWLLGEERFTGHGAVPALMRTNIPGYHPTLSEVWLDRRLERVTWVGEGDPGSMQVRRFQEGTLAEMAATRRGAAARDRAAPRRPRGEWRLRPFWQ